MMSMTMDHTDGSTPWGDCMSNLPPMTEKSEFYRKVLTRFHVRDLHGRDKSETQIILIALH